MKRFIHPLALLLSAGIILFTSCDEDTDETQINLEVQTAEDIPADVSGQPGGAPGSYTFFSLESGQIVSAADSNSTNWDLGFAGTSIITNGGTSGPGNGGAMIVDGIFEEIETAPESGYAVDTETTPAIDDSWYNYTGQTGTPQFAVLPVPGKIIMLRTAEGNYAKVEIISYYQGNPNTTTPEFADLQTRPSSRYYTFQYVLQPNGSTEF